MPPKICLHHNCLTVSGTCCGLVWHSGTLLVHCYSGASGYCYSGTLGLWHIGTHVHWHYSTLAPSALFASNSKTKRSILNKRRYFCFSCSHFIVSIIYHNVRLFLSIFGLFVLFDLFIWSIHHIVYNLQIS